MTTSRKGGIAAPERRRGAGFRARAVAAAMVPAAATLLLAAAPAALPDDVAERIRSNQRQLVQFSWTMQVAIEDAGRSLGSTTERVRFGDEGYVEREMLRDEREGAAREPETQARIERVVAAVVPYVFPNPDAAAAFLAGAEVAEEGDHLRVRGRGFLEEDDSVELAVGGVPPRVLRMSVTTLLDELPLRLRAEYQPLEDGPNVTTRITAEHRDLRLAVTNSDYERR